MDLLKEIINALIILVRVGVAFRVVFCLVRMGSSDEESGMYKKRGRNAVIFYLLAECIWQIKELVLGYYAN